MRPIRMFVVLGLVLALAAGAAAADKAKGKKANKPVQGVVTALDKDTITVQVKLSKKKGGGTTDQKFKLSDATKYETLTVTRVKGQQPQTDTKDAAFVDVKTGDRVRITPNADAAEKVSIVKGNKAKAKTKKTT